MARDRQSAVRLRRVALSLAGMSGSRNDRCGGAGCGAKLPGGEERGKRIGTKCTRPAVNATSDIASRGACG